MEKLLTLKELRTLTTLSYQTILRGMNAGTLPQTVNGRGKGRKLLWTQESIEAWMNRNATSQPAMPPVNPSKRKQDKDYKDRQSAAALIIAKHAVRKPPKGN